MEYMHHRALNCSASAALSSALSRNSGFPSGTWETQRAQNPAVTGNSAARQSFRSGTSQGKEKGIQDLFCFGRHFFISNPEISLRLNE